MAEFAGKTPTGNSNVKVEVKETAGGLLLRITEIYQSGKSGSHVIVLSKGTVKELIHHLVDQLN